ncbi:MAG: urea carboxylase-associated family protein [Congregibacter sp.]
MAVDGAEKPAGGDLLPTRLAPCSGAAFLLSEGASLKIIAPFGQQVASLTALMAHDPAEWLSGARTIDVLRRTYPKVGESLYSNRSVPMLSIEEDTAGAHDLMLAPCHKDKRGRLRSGPDLGRSCVSILQKSLCDVGVSCDVIPPTFNIFMNVAGGNGNGALRVGAPHSKAGDYITVRARLDLVVALTACPDAHANSDALKPIDFHIVRPGEVP